MRLFCCAAVLRVVCQQRCWLAQRMDKDCEEFLLRSGRCDVWMHGEVTMAKISDDLSSTYLAE